jgi:hypothetical protein
LHGRAGDATPGLYCLPTWTRTVALIRDHAGLRDVLDAVPSVDAAYRFTIKLRAHEEW